MSTATLLAVVLATWSVTQLATRDEITERPRRAFRRWLKRARHRYAEARVNHALPGRACICGWEVSVTRKADGAPLVKIQDPEDPTKVQEWSVDPHESIPHLLDELVDDHVRLAGARDPGWLYTLATCPWCVSVYIGLVVATTAVLWADTDAWWIAAAGIGSRIVAGAGVVHLGPDDDATDDDATDDDA